MNNVMGLFTSLEGRIGRGRWWLGVVILIVAGIIVSIILSMLGFGMSFGAMMGGTPESIAAAASAGASRAAWGSVISFIIFAYPSYALSIKRRHDRDSNGLDLQIYYALSFILLLLQALGVGMSTMDVGNGVVVPTPSMPMAILSIIMLIYGIYMLVVLGFLRGTAGPNRYGPDPLGAAA